jgi:RimJ/RimL family protein N-acetyltransferase
MVIEGKRVSLSPMAERDLEAVVQWRNQVRDKFIYRELFTVQSQTKWLREVVQKGKAVQYIIHEKTGNGIGSVFLKDIDKKNKKAEYGIFIGEKGAQGKGYGTEAAKLMIQYGFKELDLHKIILRVFAFNKIAIKSYEKAGFIQEGYLKDEVCIDDNYYDIVLMGIIRGENNE